MARLSGGLVDLTTIEDSDPDEVEFVSQAPRRRPKKTASARTVIPVSNGKRPRSDRKSDGQSSKQQSRKGPLVDLRSDAGISDLESQKSSDGRVSATKETDSELKKRKTMVSRKSAPSSSRLIKEDVTINLSGDDSSDGDKFPDLPQPRRSQPGGLQRAPPDSTSGKRPSSVSKSLKRPLDLASNSPSPAQVSKRPKLDKPSPLDKNSPHHSRDNMREVANGVAARMKQAVPLPQGPSAVSQQKTKSGAPLPDRLAPGNAPSRVMERPLSSPSGSHHSHDSTTNKKSNPRSDLLASEGQPAERHKSASKGPSIDRANTSNPTSPRSKTSRSNLSVRSGKNADTLRSPAKSHVAAKENTRPAERTRQDVHGTSTKSEWSPVPNELSRRQREETPPAKTPQVAKPLKQRSALQDSARPKAHRAGSSDEDQGYGSLGSGGSMDGQSHDGLPSTGSRPTSPKKAGRPRTGEKATISRTGSDNAEAQYEAREKAKSSVTKSSAKGASTDAVRETIEGRKSAQASMIGKQPPQDPIGLLPLQQTLDEALEGDQQNTSEQAASKGDSDQAGQFEAASEAAQADDQLQSEALRAQSASVFAVPHSAASALKSTVAYSKLSLANKIEKALGQYLEELAQDNEYWTSNSLMRARLSKEGDTRQANNPERPTSFRHLQPLTITPATKNDSRELTWGIEKMINGKPAHSEKFTVPRQTFTTSTRDVPSYAHYVSISNNILAQNSKTLHCWPYFGDNFDHSKADNLKEQYHVDIDGREQKLLRLRQAQRYEEYAESALEDLECSWADVLRFLLEERPAVGINPDAIKALNNRHEFCKEDFDRHSKRWVAVLSSLPPSTTEQVARAAVLCENFQKMAHFPLWHIAKRSDLCRLPDRDSPADDAVSASDELTCRICLRFNCPYHGEISERPIDEDDENDSDSSSGSVVATDLVHPPKINYRTRVAFPAMEPLSEETENLAIKPGKKEHRYWQSFQMKTDERGPFYPCSHPGKSCDDKDAECSCFAEDLPCEKLCGCDRTCARVFEGCACSTQRIRAGKRGPCFEDERCACWQAGRECDPDLCGECGVCEVVDPVNKHDETVKRGRCQNASIQRAMPKCTLLGDSGIHGLGLYACEDIRHHEFVGEYTGEIITKEEAERRGAVYEHQKLSYLFSLNRDQEIDSTYFGNKIRFINHASDNKKNLYPRIIMVNTVHRIALYADRFIRKGEELLFNYGPMFPDEQLGGKRSKKSAPHVRNANLVKEFVDVEEVEDELGNLRARGVPGGRKGKKPKPRGGARPGAGRKPRPKPAEAQAAVGHEQQRDESPFEDDDFPDQDAGERLAAYNVANDDRASDQTDVDVDAGGGAEDGEDDDYEESDEVESEVSVEDSISDDEPEDDGEISRMPGRRPIKRKSGRFER